MRTDYRLQEQTGKNMPITVGNVESYRQTGSVFSFSYEELMEIRNAVPVVNTLLCCESSPGQEPGTVEIVAKNARKLNEVLSAAGF
ncbi:MAG: hypothetical protein UX38_C0004G0012 [Microgenomates group bacterium GW2011_GWC1_46_16]|nr:MAG: hypothetical protein UX38_C0004G0012 [Microgenomates group bacterium GW2011_GWC1_46_16]